MTTPSPFLALSSGEYDDVLDDIIAAVKDRRDVIARASFFTWKPGDKATLVNLSPKYLIGAPVTVQSRKNTRIEVRIDFDWLTAHPEVTRFRGPITAKPNMLTRRA